MSKIKEAAEKARQSWQEQHKSRSKLLVGIRRT